MPITVGRVENLFWANNSYKKPNCAPELAESHEVNQRPIIYGFMGGRTHLYGDKWNYAIYKGVYYFLQIEECKDLEKQHYTYALIRDMWVNMLLNNNIEVNGFLTTTNRDEWIAANLNRAHPVLVQPCEVTRLSLVDEKQKLSEVAISKSNRNLPLILFDIRELREFKDYWNVEAAKYELQLKKDKYIRGASPIFIFAELKGKVVDTVHSWKEYLRVKLNEFLDDIGNEDLVISKVQNTDAAGRLKEHYCITWKNGGIGAGVENVVIDAIDLSGLEDIVSISPKTLEEVDANKRITEAVFRDIEFPSGYDRQYLWETKSLRVRKLRRKVYFPFTQDAGVYGISLAPRYDAGKYADNKFRSDLFNWKALAPQRLKLRGTGIKEAFLFWVDNVDFVLNYHKNAAEGVRSSGYAADELSLSTDPANKENNKRFWEKLFDITNFPDSFKIPYPSYAVGNEQWRDWFFKNNLITPLGFLIFKPFDAKRLNGYIWEGEATKRLHYISGLRRSKLERIETGEIFSEIPKLNEVPYPIWDYYNREDHSLDNPNWNRYWFNVVNGLDILLQPNQEGYLYEYRTWRPRDRTSNNYTLRYLQNDAAPWLDNKAPFYSVERHKATNDRSRRLVDWLVMKTLIDLPITLEKGDYLFNDLEYWLDNQDTTLWTDTANWYRWAGIGATYPLLQYLFNLEDFVKQPREIQDSDTNSVVICSTREGKIEIRSCIRFSRIHKLHDDIYSENLADTRVDIDSLEGFAGSKEAKLAYLGYSTNDLVDNEQAVESVDGHTSRRVGYIALKKTDYGVIEKLDEPLGDDKVNKIIASFLKANGYKLSPDNQSVLYYERTDFEAATDLFFDLKGTDWYLHVKSGKFSLIAKRPELFKPESDTVNKLKSNDHLKSLSVVEKVNQRCVLNVYTQQRLLNTRFNFDNDKLNISVKALKPSHKNNPTNYYQMNLRGDFDVIEREILQIQKKQLDEQASIVDYTALESLRTQMRRNDRDYEISMAKDVLFATEKENENYRRQKWDLSTQRMQMWMNLGLGLGQSGTGVLAGQYLMHNRQRGVAHSAEALANAASVSNIGAVVRGISAFKGVTGAIKSVANAFIANQIFDERAKRIETDRKFAFKDIAFRSMQIDLRHRDVQEDSIRTLNKMANVYSRGVINDLDAIDEFNKENKLGNINLTVFTPSKEQLVLLNALKEEYGIDCDIPNATIQITEGMSEDVIRFKHLEDEGVIGLSNKVERDYLMATLEMGVKVVDTCLEHKRRVKRQREQYACANIYELTQQIENHRIITADSGRINTELRDEVTRLKNEIELKLHEIDDKKATIEQCEAEKGRLTKDIEAKQAQLLDEQRSRKEEKEELEQKLNDERRKYLDERDKANRLTKEKEDAAKALEAKVKECTDKQASDLSAWNAERAKLEAQVKEWKDKYDQRPRQEVSGRDAPGQCELFKDLLDEPYEFNLKQRGNGWNAFMDLVFALAEESKWSEIAKMPEKMLSYPEMGLVMQRLEDLKNMPIMKRAIKLVKDDGWKPYLVWLNRGGEKNGNIDQVIGKVNEIKNLITPDSVHALKHVLDELNYLTHEALKALHEKVSGDENLEFFFAHIYPGKELDKYRELYGDPNKAIVRKRFVNEVQCVVGGGGSTFDYLNNFKQQTNVKGKVDSIIGRVRPVVPAEDLPKPPPRAAEYSFARNWDEAKYSGVLLKELIKRGSLNTYAMPITIFEDSYVSRNLENRDYSELNKKPKITRAIQFWKWPYYKKARGWNSNRKVIWFKWRDRTCASDSGDIDQYGNYLEAQDLKFNEAIGQMQYLWANRSKIVIPTRMMDEITTNQRSIKLRLRDFNGVYVRGVRNDVEVLFLGDSNNELLWPYTHLDDLFKLIFIMHYFYISPKYYGTLDADSFGVYGFDVGQYWPTRTSLRGDALIVDMNKRIASITDTEIDLQLGMLFSHMKERIEHDGDMPMPSTVPRTQQTVAFASFYAWAYWQIKERPSFYHPLVRSKVADGTFNNVIVEGVQYSSYIAAMFARMAHVKNQG